MSIVNQMLKDLDARCGPVSGNQLAALQGLGLVSAASRNVPYFGLYLGWCCAALLAILGGYHAITWWNDDQKLTYTQFAPIVAQTSDPSGATGADDRRIVEPGKFVSGATDSQLSDTFENNSETPVVTPSPVATQPETLVTLKPVEDPLPIESIKKLSSQQKADRFFADAQAALSKQDYGKGEVLLRQALFESPRHHTARAQLAALLAARQNTDAAERLLSQGLDGNNQEVQLARPYAQLLVDKGETEQALSVLNTAIDGERTDAETYALRAAVFHRLKRHSAAARDYREALAMQPQNAVWWVGLAIAEEHDQRLQQALAAYLQAVRLPMTDPLRNYVDQRIQLIQNTDGR